MCQSIFKGILAFVLSTLLLSTPPVFAEPCANLEGVDKDCFYVDGLCANWDSLVAFECVKFPLYNDYVPDEVLLLSKTFREDEITKLLHKYELTMERIDTLKTIQRTMIQAKTKGVDARVKVGQIRRNETEIDVQTNNYYRIDNIEQPSFRSLPINEYPLGMTGVLRLRSETGGQNTKICMIDTPIDIGHPTLFPDYIEMSNDIGSVPLRSMRHGTAIASILVGQHDRIGIAPRARLYAMGSFADDPKGLAQRSTTHLIVRNLERCIDYGVDIINLSFAGPSDRTLEKVVQSTLKHGIFIIASAGNEGADAPPAYPAAIPGVIAVTAVDAYRKLFIEANRGHYIDYAAPGVGILAAAPKGRFDNNYTGTSMATAHVSGIFALLLSRFGSIDRNRLAQTAIDLGSPGKDPLYGYGLINP